MCLKKTNVMVLFTAVCLLLVSTVQAMPVSVVNPEFTYTTGTSYSMGDYPTSHVNTDGWNDNQKLNGGSATIKFYDYSGVTNDKRMVLPGWYTMDSGGLSGVQALSSTEYWLGGIVPDGAIGYVQAWEGSCGIVYQTISGALQPNTSYTLAMDTYCREGHTYPINNISIYLADGSGTPLVGGSLALVAPTSSAAGSAIYTVSTGSSVDSSDLRICITLSNPGELGNYRNALNVDNVALDASPVPEPSSFAILGSAIVGLLCCAWKRRK